LCVDNALDIEDHVICQFEYIFGSANNL